MSLFNNIVLYTIIYNILFGVMDFSASWMGSRTKNAEFWPQSETLVNCLRAFFPSHQKKGLANPPTGSSSVAELNSYLQSLPSASNPPTGSSSAPATAGNFGLFVGRPTKLSADEPKEFEASHADYAKFYCLVNGMTIPMTMLLNFHSGSWTSRSGI